MAYPRAPWAADHRDDASSPQALHGDLADAVAREAARDAELVAKFLVELGLVTSSDRPVRLPAAFLIRLGAAMRLWSWESSGLQIHRDSGLPSAESATVDAFHIILTPEDPEAQDRHELARRVVALFADRFAWHGRRDLDSDVVLDDHVDENALVDALAELLWDARHVEKSVKENSDG